MKVRDGLGWFVDLPSLLTDCWPICEVSGKLRVVVTTPIVAAVAATLPRDRLRLPNGGHAPDPQDYRRTKRGVD